MGRTLHIFDMLPFIHAGHVNKYSRLERLVDFGTKWKTQVTPTGGVSWLLKNIYSAAMQGDVLVASDRTPTIKKEMYADYKANREHKLDINVERGAAEYILQKCNITLVARAGYEADDIIYSAVKKFHDSYDNIIVYTGDSDMAFLVDDKVEIKPANSKGKHITRDNYEQIAVKGGVRYNCVTMFKILTGDSSDNIPALPKDVQYKLSDWMYRDGMYERLGDKEFVRYWVSMTMPECLPQVDLVFPLDVDDLPDEFLVWDKQMLINFGDAVNGDIFRGRASIDFDVAPYVEEMQSKGLYVEEEI
ncbi:MAG: hypothetical protein NC548_29390 [Lachnospiraceae bacterium]|nr:hypothetical protein [Lachnospiraceae bacterium]